MSLDLRLFNHPNLSATIATNVGLKKPNGILPTVIVNAYGDEKRFLHAMAVDPPREILAKIIEDLKKDFVRDKNPNYIGIEVELENAKQLWSLPDDLYNAFNFLWAAKEDGSLRNNGREYITRLGASNSNCPIFLDIFDDYLEFASPKSEANARTGLHVHLNAGHWPLTKLLNFLFLYSILEPAFFEVSGNRCENLFCVPWQENRRTLGEVIYEVLQHSQNGTYTKNWRWRNYSKYCALNLSTLSQLGTLEFRMHYGTKDSAVIKRWVNTICNLADYAENSNLVENFISFRSQRYDWKYRQLFSIVFNQYPALNEEIVRACKEATINTLRGFVPDKVYQMNVVPKKQAAHPRGFALRWDENEDEPIDIHEEGNDQMLVRHGNEGGDFVGDARHLGEGFNIGGVVRGHMAPPEQFVLVDNAAINNALNQLVDNAGVQFNAQRVVAAHGDDPAFERALNMIRARADRIVREPRFQQQQEEDL